MKVLLCGSAGFTGRAILEELLAAGHHVRAWDLKPESYVPGIDDETALTNPRTERVYGSIADFDLVQKYVSGCDAIVHTTVLFMGDGAGAPGEFSGSDQNHSQLQWIVNLKGLWNVLECATAANCRRVVHIGSCQHEWPGVEHLSGKQSRGSVFFSADVRRPDASQYAVHKRLQEEMCRQFYDGTGLRIVVLRPSGIIDVPQRLYRDRRVLSKVWSDSSVSRHHLGQAACAALRDGTADFAVLHAVTIPTPPLTSYDPRSTSNVGLAPQFLDGFDFSMDVRKYGYVGGEAAPKL